MKNFDWNLLSHLIHTTETLWLRILLWFINNAKIRKINNCNIQFMVICKFLISIILIKNKKEVFKLILSSTFLFYDYKYLSPFFNKNFKIFSFCCSWSCCCYDMISINNFFWNHYLPDNTLVCSSFIFYDSRL